MASAPMKTVLLGSENDERLGWILNDVVLRLGGKQRMHEWAVEGSQAFERVEAEVRSSRLFIDAKTNVGLSISGPIELVDEIHTMVKRRF